MTPDELAIYISNNAQITLNKVSAVSIQGCNYYLHVLFDWDIPFYVTAACKEYGIKYKITERK